MRLGIITDIHFHKYSSFSGIDGRRRLEDGLKVFKYSIQYFAEKRCNAVAFLGDLWHARGVLDIDAFNSFIDLLPTLPLSDFEKVLWLVGNHDWYDNMMSTSALNMLRYMGANQYVVDKPVRMKLGKSLIAAIPWMPADEIALWMNKHPKRNRHTILLLHTTPYGSLTATGHKMKSGVNFEQIRRCSDIAFCGDIHKRQIREGLVVCGTPMQHNFGDEGQERGIHIYDDESREVEFHDLRGISPEFIVLTEPSRAELSSKNYYRVFTREPERYDGLDNVETVLIKSKVKSSGKLNISPVTTPTKAISRYAKSKADGLDIDKLVHIGMDALR